MGAAKQSDAGNAASAWATRSKGHTVKSRTDFVAGYEAGVFDARLAFVNLIAEHGDAIRAFAGPRTDELLIYMLTHLRPRAYEPVPPDDRFVMNNGESVKDAVKRHLRQPYPNE